MLVGANTSAGTAAAQNNLEPDVAERFASTFVPIWQFDDAPFTAGGALSHEDVRALGGDSGATSGRSEPPASAPIAAAGAAVLPAEPATAPAAASAQVPAEALALVEAPALASLPPAAEAPLPEPAREPVAVVPVAAVSTDDLQGSELFRRRPSKRLLVGGGLGLAAILVLVTVAFIRAEAPSQSASVVATVPSTRGPEGPSVPPPPPLSEVTVTSAAETTAPPRAPAPQAAAGPSSMESTPSLAPPRPTTDHPARGSASPPKKGSRPTLMRPADVDFGI